MTISKIAFAGSICVAAVIGSAVGVLAGIRIGKTKSQNEIDEANAMTELWKKRAEKVHDEKTAEEISVTYSTTENPHRTRIVGEDGRIDVKHAHSDIRESRNYTKYYSRKALSNEDEEEVVDIHPNPNHSDPPRVVSQDEAMADDSDCLELEYHIKDEALVDPNIVGAPDLISPEDAFVMVGNILRVPSGFLPNTVYIYSPARDQYYEIYIYDNYWDPPEEEYDDAPKVEKMKKRGRFDD